MSVEEFLAWAENAPGRYELVAGEIIAQAAERAAHAKVKGAVFVSLLNGIARAGLSCHALPDGMAVRVDAATVYEPDAQVYCGAELAPHALIVENPVIIVEVISPSTGHNDALGKLHGHFRLASVKHYLVVDPHRPLIIHHARGEGETLLTRLHSPGAIRLDPPGLVLEVSEIYEGPRDFRSNEKSG